MFIQRLFNNARFFHNRFNIQFETSLDVCIKKSLKNEKNEVTSLWLKMHLYYSFIIFLINFLDVCRIFFVHLSHCTQASRSEVFTFLSQEQEEHVVTA